MKCEPCSKFVCLVKQAQYVECLSRYAGDTNEAWRGISVSKPLIVLSAFLILSVACQYTDLYSFDRKRFWTSLFLTNSNRKNWFRRKTQIALVVLSDPPNMARGWWQENQTSWISELLTLHYTILTQRKYFQVFTARWLRPWWRDLGDRLINSARFLKPHPL